MFHITEKQIQLKNSNHMTPVGKYCIIELRKGCGILISNFRTIRKHLIYWTRNTNTEPSLNKKLRVSPLLQIHHLWSVIVFGKIQILGSKPIYVIKCTFLSNWWSCPATRYNNKLKLVVFPCSMGNTRTLLGCVI